ncbi:hypothetical protein NDU88_006148 [Pleurodeles waltl]|uniref:Uncharacterized protein n=1 Tax=Pleurodeles waltl TaxID=8319 RepID=A0AAV7TDZ6_PLEWA|nr:hypothetical protein NDU88_006148 [Pleurodeles waltl]
MYATSTDHVPHPAADVTNAVLVPREWAPNRPPAEPSLHVFNGPETPTHTSSRVPNHPTAHASDPAQQPQDPEHTT